MTANLQRGKAERNRNSMDLIIALILQATSSICMGANIGHHAARNFKEDWLSKPTHLTALRPVRALRTFSATGQGPGPRAG